jgi:glucan phosphoethanolaminetransferase (alkaline phosphatase superfamily)
MRLFYFRFFFYTCHSILNSAFRIVGSSVARLASIQIEMIGTLLLVFLLLLVLFVMIEYVQSYMRLRALGVPFSLGVPLLYRMVFFLQNLDNLYDVIVREFGETSMRAVKRSFLSPIMLISADPAVNKYILENTDKYQKGTLVMFVCICERWFVL